MKYPARATLRARGFRYRARRPVVFRTVDARRNAARRIRITARARQAEAGLERTRRIVDAGMNHAAVVRAHAAPRPRLALDDAHDWRPDSRNSARRKARQPLRQSRATSISSSGVDLSVLGVATARCAPLGCSESSRIDCEASAARDDAATSCISFNSRVPNGFIAANQEAGKRASASSVSGTSGCRSPSSLRRPACTSSDTTSISRRSTA